MDKQIQMLVLMVLWLLGAFQNATAQSDSCHILGEYIQKLYYEGKVRELIPIAIRTCTICKHERGDTSLEYASALANVGSMYYTNGESVKAFPYLIESEQILNARYPNTFEQGMVCNMLSGVYSNMGILEKAEHYVLKFVSIARKIGEKSPTYANSLNTLGVLYKNQGLWTKAETALLESKRILQDSLDIPMVKLHYIAAMSNLATLYGESGNPLLAERYCQETLQFCKKNGFEKHSYYVATLATLTSVYSELDLDEKAAEIIEKELEAVEKEPGGLTSYHGAMCNNFAEALWEKKQYERAEYYNRKALDILRHTLGKTSRFYLVSYANYGNKLIEKKDYSQSIAILQSAADSLKSRFGESNEDYLSARNGLSQAIFKNGDMKTAIEIGSQNLRIAQIALGETRGYATILFNLAAYHQADKNFAAMERLTRQYIDLFCRQSFKKFAFFTEKEKSDFLQKRIPEMDVCRGRLFFSSYRETPKTVAAVYDQTLALKGILLLDAQKKAKSFLEHTDNATSSAFRELKEIRQTIAKQETLPPQRHFFKQDSLSKVADTLETYLVRSTDSLRFLLEPATWQSVRQSLAPDEAAIEFISFRGTRDGETLSDSVLYCALVLRPDFDAPHFVWLFEEKQLVKTLNQPGTLKNRVGSAYYDTDKLYQLLWKPLEPHLGTAQRIWYAPDGLLHSVAFPAITRAGKRTLAHDLELFSLGSTRELIGRDPMPAPKMGTATLFGGARYDADSSCLQRKIGEVPPDLLDIASIPNNQKGDCRPVKFDFLSWSYREVVWLDSLLRSRGMTTHIHTNCAASEEAVLETGRNGENAPDILHISTHALYCDTTADRAVRPGREPDFAANPLLRPRLALAGINRKLAGDPPYEGLEDGELFANDIKDLLLTNTGLVVLSACGTGLGSIRSGEGVFGMQRAFKLAGARHVLVSLWDVKDKETHDLMRAFYANWFGGMDIREAFLAAQRKMAQQGLHPYYWAGWVLI